MIAAMKTVQPIIHQGRIAALVVAGQAIIDDTLPPHEHRHVQAMCLYALEVADRDRPGPYSDPDADTYARQALTTS